MELVFLGPDVQGKHFPGELLAILHRIGYKPGWALALMRPRDGLSDVIWIHPTMCVVDVQTGLCGKITGPGFATRASDTPAKIIKGVFGVIERLEIHECAEQFRYAQVRIFNPHVSNRERDRLWYVASGQDLAA